MAMTVVPSDDMKTKIDSCLDEDDGDKLEALIKNAADESVKGIRQKTMIGMANASDIYGNSFFKEAVKEGRPNIVRILLKYGARINELPNKYLHEVAESAAYRDDQGDRYFEIVKILMDAGMDPMLKLKYPQYGRDYEEKKTASESLSIHKEIIMDGIFEPQNVAEDYPYNLEDDYDSDGSLDYDELEERREASFKEYWDFERVEKALQKNQEGNVPSLQRMARHVLRMENPSLVRELPKHLQSNVTVKVEGYAF